MLICVSSAAIAAQQTKIRFQQIIVAGNQNVEATSINNHGAIVGNLYAGITDAVSGIEIDGDTVTTLPPPYADGAVPHPRVIDDAGDVLGWVYNGIGDPSLFLVKDGMTIKRYEMILDHDEGGQNFIVQPMGIIDRSVVFGTTIVSLTAPTSPFYGVPDELVHVKLFNSFEHLNSINRHSVVGGVSFTFSGRYQVFFGTKGHYKVLSPPGATSSQGGYVNDAGEVAGSYTDDSGLQHGFTYYAGKYRTFDMPEPASNVTVTAINAAGRVVGTYAGSSPNARQHSFLYNGQTVTSFGLYSSLDTVLLSLNDRGDMLIDRQLEFSYYPHFLSYRATCEGPDC